MNFRYYLAFVFVFVFACANAHGAESSSRVPFDIPESHHTNLMKETEHLHLNQEASVQNPRNSQDHYFRVGAGQFRAGRVAVKSRDKITIYDLSDPLTVGAVMYEGKIISAYGKWGLGLGLLYGNRDKDTSADGATRLHVLDVGVNLNYRGDFRASQVLVPFVSGGFERAILTQRGALEAMNATLQATLFEAVGGLAINLNRLGLFSSRNDSEVFIEYRDQEALAGFTSDLNSKTWLAGWSMGI